MDKKVKIGLGVGLSAVIITLFIRIYTQKGGFGGLSISNKSKSLQDIFATFRNNDANVTTSSYNDPVGYVDFNFKAPYGNILFRFEDDGKLTIVKAWNNETYKGTWSSDGKLNIENVGQVYEGDIFNSARAFGAVII
ncbi:hypothetical protein EBU94_02090 [bacterium]|nr:hypothetical protein [bacterium]